MFGTTKSPRNNSNKNIKKNNNTNSSLKISKIEEETSKVEEEVKIDLLDYLQFYKERREISNYLTKISLTFYSELLLLADIKNGSKTLITDEMHKFDINKKLNTIINFNNEIQKNIKDPQYFIKNLDLFENKDVIEAFSIINLSNLFIDTFTKIYLSNILSKKNVSTVKNIEISKNLEKFLSDLKPTEKYSNIDQVQTLNNVVNQMKSINQFQTKINNSVNKLNKYITNIQNESSYQISEDKKSSLNDEYTKNLIERINELGQNLDKLVKHISKYKNKQSINKKDFLIFIQLYINIISNYYRLMALTYEWKYFVKKLLEKVNTNKNKNKNT